MQINNPNICKTPQINKLLPQQNAVKSTGLAKDSFEVATYNKDDFTAELENIKDEEGSRRFDVQCVFVVTGTLDNYPDKYSAIKTLAHNKSIDSKNLMKLSRVRTESLNLLAEFSKKTDANNKPKYSGKELVDLANLPTRELEAIKPLTDTSLKADSLRNLAPKSDIDFEEVSKKINDFESTFDKKQIAKIDFDKDTYEPDNCYFFKATMKDGSEKTQLTDKNYKTLSVSDTQNYVSSKNKEYSIVKTNDFRNNTISKVRYYLDDAGYPIVENQIRIIKDKNGKTQYTEYMQPSEVKGVYDTKLVYANGKEKQVSSGKIDKKTGIVSVIRDMKSLDGTRTEYLYENDPQGNKIIDYKITDKNGKELLKLSQSFEVINDNKFITSKNDKSYEITVSDDKKLLTVKDRDTKEENQLNLGTMLTGNKDSMVNLLKKFPGEELIKLKDTTSILKGMDKIEDCCFWPDKKEIDVVDDLYSVLHELGHSKDNYQGSDIITKNKDLQKVYDGEREAFNKAFPNAQREHINYFIDVENHYSGERGGLNETIAESNALLNTYNGELDIAARAQYLQQYFPKTIAYLGNNLL